MFLVKRIVGINDIDISIPFVTSYKFGTLEKLFQYTTINGERVIFSGFNNFNDLVLVCYDTVVHEVVSLPIVKLFSSSRSDYCNYVIPVGSLSFLSTFFDEDEIQLFLSDFYCRAIEPELRYNEDGCPFIVLRSKYSSTYNEYRLSNALSKKDLELRFIKFRTLVCSNYKIEGR